MIENNSMISMGKRMSFVELMEETTVEIPKIQRDYAQGRKNDKVEVIRSNFIDALITYLSDNDYFHDLDFVYGASPENLSYQGNFIPLDGQQRLTTLFLLHWYLAAVNDAAITFRELMFKKEKDREKCRFSYQTRESSRLFCEGLVNCSVNPQKEKEKLSEVLKNEYWYFSSWGYDPSVSGMLNMLDTIHNKLCDLEDKDLALYYRKLFGMDKDEDGNRLFAITFQRLDMGDFGLTDDLYIKMNSRGVPLTDFEIFKSKIEQLISDDKFFNSEEQKRGKVIELSKGIQSRMSLPKYFSHQMDKDWANLFWKYAITNDKNGTKIFDIQLMRFIRFIFVCTYSIEHVLQTKRGLSRKPYSTAFDPLDVLMDTRKARQLYSEEELNNLSFYRLKSCDVFSPFAMEFLMDALDIMTIAYPENGKIVIDEALFNLKETWEVLMYGDYFHSLDNVQLIRLYAYIAYLVQAKKAEADLFDKDLIIDFKRWMRFVNNITVRNTTRTDSPDAVAQAIWSLNNLLEGTKANLYMMIAYLPDSNIKTYSFNDIQMKEERLKANLVLKGTEDWESALMIGERCEYLNGQIGFLLDYAGVYDAFHDKEFSFNPEWEEAESMNIFCKYRDKASNLFDAMTENIKKVRANRDQVNAFEKEALIERALLSINDYLPNYYREIYTLANVPESRDFSWRKMLSMHSDYQIGRDTFKELLDNCQFNDKDNVIKELQEFISVHTPLTGEDLWREVIINTPEICNYPENGFIGFTYDKSDKITGAYVISKSRWNSYHSELFSFGLYYYLQKTFTKENVFGYTYSVSENEDKDICCWIYEDYDNSEAWYMIKYNYIDAMWHISYYLNDNENAKPQGKDKIFATKEEVRDFLKQNCSF